MLGQLSLARTAELLAILGKSDTKEVITGANPSDYSQALEDSGWGSGHRLKPALTVGDAKMFWDKPAPKLGTSAPVWATAIT
jgi:hypothetical protein